MNQIEVRVWIDRPAEKVYAYVVDFDRRPEWRTDAVGGELLTEGPIGVGTQARGIGKVLGRPCTMDVEVTALEHGIRFRSGPSRGH
jgi:uncharacterized protein YndB with AHSA1/START domain